MSDQGLRFGDYISMTRGLTWEAHQERDRHGTHTYPVLRIPNIQTRLSLEDLVFIKVAQHCPIDQFRANHGTIIMVGSNGNPKRIGNPVFIESDTDFLFASFLVGLKIIQTSDIDPKFAYHFLASPKIQDIIARSVQGTTGLKNLSERTIENLRFPALPAVQQLRISEILDTLDDAIRQTEQVIDKLQRIKQGLLHDLLTRGIDENGELRDPERHPEQFKDSPLGRIPREWEVCTANDVCELITKGTTPPANGYSSQSTGVQFLRVDNLTFHGDLNTSIPPLHLNPRVHKTTLSRSIALPGDVLMNIVGPPLGKVGSILAGTGEWNVNQAIAIFRPVNSQSPEFLKLSVLGTRSQGWLKNRAKQTSGQVNLTLELCRQLPIARPQDQEQKRIINVASIASDHVDSESRRLASLRNIKQGLMDDLLTGRVRVSLPSAAG